VLDLVDAHRVSGAGRIIVVKVAVRAQARMEDEPVVVGEPIAPPLVKAGSQEALDHADQPPAREEGHQLGEEVRVRVVELPSLGQRGPVALAVADEVDVADVLQGRVDDRHEDRIGFFLEEEHRHLASPGQ
jgi:hypothetical protein